MKRSNVFIIALFVILVVIISVFSTQLYIIWKRQVLIDNMQLNNSLNKTYTIDTDELINSPINVPYIINKYNADTFNIGDTIKGSFALNNNAYVKKISIIPKYSLNIKDTLYPKGDSLFVEFNHIVEANLTKENPFDSTLNNYELRLRIQFPHPIWGDIAVESFTNVYVRKQKILKDKTSDPILLGVK